MWHTLRLKDKVAIVTGSSRGIGKEIALTFAREGAKVCINYVSSEDRAKEVLEEILNMDGEAIMVKSDISNKNEVEHMIEKTLREFSKIDILVNNAAVFYKGSILDFDEEKLDAMWRVNVKGAIYCIREVAKHMIKRRYGKIINIASTAAIGTATPETTLYALTKAAIIILTKRLAYELGPYGINVNAIAPSFVLTDMYIAGRSREELEKELERRKTTISLRKVAEPKDIANVALFLASDESSFITGQVIVVDGARIDYLTHSI